MGETWLLLNKPVHHQSKYVATAKYNAFGKSLCTYKGDGSDIHEP
jgi:hypothetical protein